MPLEPIDDKDMDLQSKFSGNARTEEKPAPREEKAALFEPAAEKERLPQEGSIEKEQAYARILSKVKAPSHPEEKMVAVDAKAVSEEASAEAKIEMLVKLAMTKGVIHAVKAAKHMEDNYTLDEFHDRLLADELHDALVQKGIIEQ